MSLPIEAESSEPCLDPCLVLTLGATLLVVGIALIIFGTLIERGRILVEEPLKGRLNWGFKLGGTAACLLALPALGFALSQCNGPKKVGCADATCIGVSAGLESLSCCLWLLRC